jgi:deoxyribonuclease V
VAFDRRQRRVLEAKVAVMDATFPYVPGLLSFRELPVLLEAMAGVERRPEVFLVDGQGMAHPRRFGIATHLGVTLDVPTIGCAKSRLVGETRGMPGDGQGCRRLLYDGGEAVGMLLRTRTGVKPMWISPGHRMDIDSAARITLACTGRYRIPEPIRAAHQLVNDARRRSRGR